MDSRLHAPRPLASKFRQGTVSMLKVTTTITQRVEWDAAHRVLGHDGKCRFLHGHRYAAEVTLAVSALDGLGMALDFGLVKLAVKGWVDENWDHNVMCHRADPLVALWNASSDPASVASSAGAVFAGKKPYVMKHGNPTAELIARELFEWCDEVILANEPVAVVSVTVWETPNCRATHSRSVEDARALLEA